MKRERLLFTVTMAVVVAAVAISVIAVALWWRDQAADCQRAVDNRADGRAMFEYLLGSADNPTDPRVIAFRDELDARLPVLQCEDGKPVPINPEEP